MRIRTEPKYQPTMFGVVVLFIVLAIVGMFSLAISFIIHKDLGSAWGKLAALILILIVPIGIATATFRSKLISGVVGAICLAVGSIYVLSLPTSGADVERELQRIVYQLPADKFVQEPYRINVETMCDFSGCPQATVKRTSSDSSKQESLEDVERAMKLAGWRIDERADYGRISATKSDMKAAAEIVNADSQINTSTLRIGVGGDGKLPNFGG